MNDDALVKTLISLFKVAVFLGIGAMLGFFLGLAYASHLYGTPPVVTQMQNWLAGDSLYEGPLPVDMQGGLMQSPVALIPKIGACIGFGIAVSVLSSSYILRIFMQATGKFAKRHKEADQKKEP
ncbi:MAG: hypothetical protein K2X27_19775 [Candidatus Obscuribacterales bacterium]|nr:hypothetical protein [Candidatus Obscuribacterales bacterium]